MVVALYSKIYTEDMDCYLSSKASPAAESTRYNFWWSGDEHIKLNPISKLTGKEY